MITKCLGLVSASSKMENYCSHLHYYIVQLMEVTTILLCASTAWTSSSSVANKMLFLKWSERSKGFFSSSLQAIFISFSFHFLIFFQLTSIALAYHSALPIFHVQYFMGNIWNVRFSSVCLYIIDFSWFSFLMYFIAQQAAKRISLLCF
jgi:hypothetical protein